MPDPNILLVANRTCPCPDVLELLERRVGEAGRVHIVAPALNRRLRHWMSDTDAAVRQARDRMDDALAWLRRRGVEVGGEVGDAHPLTAIEDALVRFRATEIVISTYPPEHSNWLERDIVPKAGERFSLPIVHLVSEYGLEHAAGVALAA